MIPQTFDVLGGGNLFFEVPPEPRRGVAEFTLCCPAQGAEAVRFSMNPKQAEHLRDQLTGALEEIANRPRGLHPIEPRRAFVRGRRIA